MYHLGNVGADASPAIPVPKNKSLHAVLSLWLLPLLQLELVSSGYDFSSASERPVESLLCYQYGKLGLNRYSGGLAETIVPYQNQEQ